MLTVQEPSLDWALRHALAYGDTDVFPIPFEYRAIQHDWDNVRPYLAAQNVLEWAVRPHRVLLSPKAKYGFRFITQLDPLDFLLFSAVVSEMAQEIEGRRIAVHDNKVFSYRVSIDESGQLFDPRIGYRSYLSQCQQVLNQNPHITFVAATDIADFYSRIYHHRLDNALQASTTRASHRKSIMHLLSGWNGTETFGIPIGNAPSRLLAEITLSDVDEALLANGIDFVRYNDDYRLFASSYTEAYRYVAFLADILFRNHGLSLQPQKTSILPVDQFRLRFLTTPLDREINSLHDRFEELADDLGLSNWYEPIEYDDLDDDQREAIDMLNLAELFREEMDRAQEPDLAVIRFVLRRLAQLGDDSVLGIIFDNIEDLLPAFPDIIRYLASLRFIATEQRHSIGERILDLLANSILSELVYHRMWALDLFTHSREWDNEDRFPAMYASEADPSIRRKLILTMGRSNHRHWFQSQWRRLFDHAHWPRRALIAGASCMPADARRHWYRSIEPQLDVLELAVARWARQNPFA